MGWAGNVYSDIDHWINTEKEWDSFKIIIPTDSWIEIKYEELLENPRYELSRICDFMGIDFSSDMFSYNEHTTYSAPDPNFAY